MTQLQHLASLFTLFEPREFLLISEYADRHRWLSKEAHRSGGKYDSSFAPYQREPMNSPLDPTVIKTVLMWASQTGKTETVNNIVAYFIDWRPSPILVVQPTLKPMAEAWSKDRLMPMCRDSPRLRGLISSSKSRDSGNTVFHKSFPGGQVSIGGANSPSSLASRPIRVCLLDEVDRYPASAGAEGDPCELAIQRTDTFDDSVVILTSTPTIKGVSKIDAEFDGRIGVEEEKASQPASDKRYFFMPCPKCGTFQHFKWEQFLFEFPASSPSPLNGERAGVRGVTDEAASLEARPEDAVLVCENSACQHHITDPERVAMVRDPRSEWRATAPFNGVRGFHLNGFYSPFKCKKGYKNRLHQAAARYLAAKRKGRYALQVFTNTFLGLAWEEVGERIETKDLLKRREDYGPEIPDEVLVLTCSVDGQADRLELEVTGWGVDYESWGVEYHVLPGNPHQPHVYGDLETFLQRTWKTKDGRELRISATCIDSGFATDEVLAFTKPRFADRVFAVKGSNIAGSPLVGVISRNNRRKAAVFRVGTDTAKEMIHSRLRLAAPGPGFMHYTRRPEARFDEVYFSGLTAEEPQLVIYKGVPRRKWVKTRPRNEQLDIRVYACAAIAILQPDWPVLIKKLPPRPSKPYDLASAPESARTDPKPETPPAAKPNEPLTPKPKPFVGPRKSFVGGHGGAFTKGWKKF